MADISYDDVDDGGSALYGDLQSFGESDVFLSQRVKELEASLKERDATIQKQQQELAALTTENSALQEEKKTLTRNISCLYRTAVEELERKNKQIQQLQQQQETRK